MVQKEFMDMTNWKGNLPIKSETEIAKKQMILGKNVRIIHLNTHIMHEKI